MENSKIVRSKLINIISIILIIFAAILFLYLIVLYRTHSPEFVTHEQFYSAMAVIGIAFFSGLLGMWMNLSNNVDEFIK